MAQEQSLARIAALAVEPGAGASLSSTIAKRAGKTGGPLLSGGGKGKGKGNEDGTGEEPTVWDDLLLSVGWLEGVAESDKDPACRALASTMLRNAVLRDVVFGPIQEVAAAAEAASAAAGGGSAGPGKGKGKGKGIEEVGE